jgi:hypothetical protein
VTREYRQEDLAKRSALERGVRINGEHPQNRKEWSKKFEGLWLVKFFGILRFAQDDSRNKNNGKG